MVTVKEYKQRQSKAGDDFFVLVFQGGVTLLKSKKTGRMYFTAKTCTVSSTFDEETCKQLVGSEFPGHIVNVETEPYEFAILVTGEIIEMSHRWEYQDDTQQLVSENPIAESQVL